MTDKNGKAVMLSTKLSDLAFDYTKILPLVHNGDLDAEQLNKCLTDLNIGDPNASTGFANMNTNYRLNAVLAHGEITLQGVVHLFKASKQTSYAKLILQFAQSFSNAIRELKEKEKSDQDLATMMAGLGAPTGTSSPRSTPTSTAITGSSADLATVLLQLSTGINTMNQQMSDNQINLATMIHSLNSNMLSSSSSASYAKTPTTNPPTFTNTEKKNCLSLRRFYKNKFSRWMMEQKLRDSDTFIYLHKIFPLQVDQERAYALVQKHKEEGIDRVLSALSQFFRLNDLEIIELQEKFFSFRIEKNSSFEDSFNRLFELQASILADEFVEEQAIPLVKNQFRRCVQRLSSESANLLKAIFIGQKWTDANTLDSILQLLRELVGKSRNDIKKETPRQSEQSVQHTTPNPDDMDVSAISASTSSSSSSKKKNKKGKKAAKSKKSNKGFIFCAKGDCKAKNIFFAKFCNTCGAEMPKAGVSVLEAKDTTFADEDEEFKAHIACIRAEEEDSAEGQVSVNENKVFVLDRTKHGKKGSLPTVQVKFFNEARTKNSKAYKSLFDTGARLNYINQDTFNNIRNKYALILFNCKYRHETASGDSLGVLGYTILPEIEVTDSFNNKFIVKSAQFRVVPHLSHQVIVGRNIMEAICPGDNGFLMLMDPVRVLLNVSLKSLNLKNVSKSEPVNSIESANYYDIDSKGELNTHALEPEDVLIASIEPLAVKLVNVGSPAEPIWTSSERSPWFISQLKSLISRYRSCTSTTYKPFKIDPIKIELTGHIPTGNQRFINLQPHLRKIMKRKVDKMVQEGILRYTNKPANGCLMLTAKNNGVDPNMDAAWRVVNDLVHVNKYVKPVDYHLPPIMDLLNQCHGYSIYAKFDVPDAYNNVPIISEEPIVAMVPGHTENVEYLKLAQGLAPASGIFCKVLDKFFNSMEELLKYLDDLLLKAKSEAELLTSLEKFFQICEKYDVRISLAKSRIGVNTLEFLSYKIHNGRIGISDSHRSAIESIKGKDIPADSLAGFLGYFQNYICDKDLLHLLRDTKDGWSEEKEKALNRLKEKILTAPMRTLVNFKNELRIYVDAADSGFSTALFQVDNSGKFMEVVSLFNKNMSEDSAWNNKNIYQRELIALATAVQKYEYMLRGAHKVVIFTDNQALSQSKKSRAFSIRNLFDRLSSDFSNVSVKFLTSQNNSVADILSRANKIKIDQVDHVAKIPTEICRVSTRNQTKLTKNKNSETPAEPEPTNKENGKATVETNISTKKKSDPKNLENLIRRFIIFHEKGGHHSAEKMFGFYKRIYSRQYPGLTLNRLREVLANCSCPTRKRDLTNFVPRFPSTNRELFLDFKEVGTSRCPLENSRKMYRLSIMEPLSGALFSIPHKITTGESVVNSLCMFLQLHGKVLSIRADNAPAFVKGPLKKFCDGCDIKIKPSSVYNPTGNLSERHHSNINRIINLANKPSFEEANQLIFDYVTSYNCIPATHGYAPYEVLKGQIPVECLPSELDYDLDKRISQKLTSAQITDRVWEQRAKTVVDKLPNKEKEQKFSLGQSVFWHINMPTGGLKIFPAKIMDLNQSSALLELEDSKKTRWIALHHIRPAANFDLLSLEKNKN